MDNLLNFKSKKERDDFLIALVVIALFGLLFWWLFTDKEVVPIQKKIDEVVAVATIVDTDGDGIADDKDKCPNLAGTAVNDGCPNDADGDGVADVDDKCPELAGSPTNNGCPKDADGDGVPDKKDDCPELAGVIENDGCPADSDGDGVYDKDDKCPNRIGPPSRGGCPELKMEEAEKAILAEAMQSVEFQTGSSILVGNSKATLNQIIGVLRKYPAAKMTIVGHTDNQGDVQANMELSNNRAKACYDFIASQGIPRRRLSYEGQGQSMPLYSNDTPQGRQKNRRVEFKMHY